MDWTVIAGKAASLGLPILAQVIGGLIEEVPILGSLVDGPQIIESVGRMALSKALGVENTPEAVGAAIENKPTSEVVATLQNVQSGLVDKWPALAALATAVAKEQTAQTAIEAEDRRDARTAATKWNEANNPLALQQRRLSVIWVTSFFVIFMLMTLQAIFYPNIKMSEPVILLLGVVIGSVKDIMQFFFGSSAGSAAKDATIRQITEASVPPPTPPAPIVVAAPAKNGKR